MDLDQAATHRSSEQTSEGSAQPQGRETEPAATVLLVDRLEVRVGMHESGTSAVGVFVDDRGREQRVSLVARQGGGALTTCVPKRYEEAMRALGQMLWPDSQWAHRRSGAFRV
jgi:hypothetical protein